MMKSKVELIYCIMVVATAVMAGIVKCTVAATCPNCSEPPRDFGRLFGLSHAALA
ncbi:hypothetical protein [Xanthomonas fragariae]|uniref:hypothetical protein n=1 Tax=Xanthomonas fragariae TaxID=48664 RepID=UPI001ABEC490|nr:hypothetical protein [Xanthomonas fragariae]UKR53570.1 hypothetical protein K4A87_06640 [Xanthomonas fragariae]